jgi:hypothetical protein
MILIWLALFSIGSISVCSNPPIRAAARASSIPWRRATDRAFSIQHNLCRQPLIKRARAGLPFVKLRQSPFLPALCGTNPSHRPGFRPGRCLAELGLMIS